MTTKAGTGVMQPQAKEHLEPPEAGRGKEGSSPRVQPCLHLHLDLHCWPPELQDNKLALF